MREEALLDENGVDSRQRKRGDTARLESGRARDLSRSGTSGSLSSRRRCDLGGVGTTVAGDHDEHRTSVAFEDERLDDLASSQPAASAASWAVGVGVENSSTRASTRASRSADATRSTAAGQSVTCDRGR